MQLNPGTRLGPYEVRSLVGAGAMGEVYRARDARLGRDVAVKVLPRTDGKPLPLRKALEYAITDGESIFAALGEGNGDVVLLTGAVASAR